MKLIITYIIMLIKRKIMLNYFLCCQDDYELELHKKLFDDYVPVNSRGDTKSQTGPLQLGVALNLFQIKNIVSIGFYVGQFINLYNALYCDITIDASVLENGEIINVYSFYCNFEAYYYSAYFQKLQNERYQFMSTTTQIVLVSLHNIQKHILK